MKTKALAVFCVLALILAGTPQCLAQDDRPAPGAGAIAADTLFVRPACLVATIVGSALFVISLPIAAVTKSVHQTAHALVVKPAEATFKRPLGDMEDLEAW